MYHKERYRVFELVPESDGKPFDSEAIVIAMEHVKAYDGVRVKWENNQPPTKIFLNFPGHIPAWEVIEDLIIKLAEKGYR